MCCVFLRQYPVFYLLVHRILPGDPYRGLRCQQTSNAEISCAPFMIRKIFRKKMFLNLNISLTSFRFSQYQNYCHVVNCIQFLGMSGEDKCRSCGSVNDDVSAKVKLLNQGKREKNIFLQQGWIITRRVPSMNTAYFHLAPFTPF